MLVIILFILSWNSYANTAHHTYTIKLAHKKEFLNHIEELLKNALPLPMVHTKRWKNIWHDSLSNNQIHRSDTLSDFVLNINKIFDHFGLSHLSLSAEVFPASKLLSMVGEDNKATKYLTYENQLTNSNIDCYYKRYCHPGLKIQVLTGNKEVLVLDVRKHYPAYCAGIRPGDIIQRLDKKKIYSCLDLSGYPDEQIRLKVKKGVKNCFVKLKLFRVKTDDKHASCTFDWLDSKSISDKSFCKKKIGLLRLSHLQEIKSCNSRIESDEDTPIIKNVLKILNQFKTNKGDLLVLDLRGNSGGSFKLASILSALLVKNRYPLTVLGASKKDLNRWDLQPKELYEKLYRLVKGDIEEKVMDDLENKEKRYVINQDTCSEILKNKKHIIHSDHFKKNMEYRNSGYPNLVVLVDGFTKSCGEILAKMLQCQGVPVIGRQTSGSVVAISAPEYAAYTSKERFDPGSYNKLPSYHINIPIDSSLYGKSAINISGSGDIIMLKLIYPIKTFLFMDHQQKSIYALEGHGIVPNESVIDPYSDGQIESDRDLEKAICIGLS